MSLTGTKYFATSTVRVGSPAVPPQSDGNLSADDPEQTLVLGVEHARAGVAGCGDVADQSGEAIAQIRPDLGRRHNVRTGSSFGVATTTVSLAIGGVAQSGIRRICKRTGSFVESMDSRVRSTSSRSPSFTNAAGRSCPAKRTWALCARNAPGRAPR